MKMSVLEFVEGKLGVKAHLVSNRNWMRALCPYHQETRPSFGVLLEPPYLVKCYGCGVRESLIKFAANMLQISQVRAKEIIEESVDIKLEADAKPEHVDRPVSDAIQEFYEYSFPGSLAEKYTKYRGIPKWATKMWQFGFDELNTALVVPMRNTMNGKIMGHLSVAIQGSFEEVFKSKNCDHAGTTVTTPDNYAAFDSCVVVEGPVDGVKAAEVMWRQDIKAVPVTLNTAYPSNDQLNFIRRFKRVILGLDHDSTGQRAREFCVGKFKDKALLYDFVYPEARKDPGELTPDDKIGLKLIV